MLIFQKISLGKIASGQQATYCNCFTAIFCNKNSFPKFQNTINDAALLLRKFADKPQMCHNNV